MERNRVGLLSELWVGELWISSVPTNSNYCGFGISDFGNKVKYLCFLQNIEDYTSEIQHPK